MATLFMHKYRLKGISKHKTHVRDKVSVRKKQKFFHLHERIFSKA